MNAELFFKISRNASHRCTTKGTYLTLRKRLEEGFWLLKSKGFLQLPPQILTAIVECAATSPDDVNSQLLLTVCL